jgi:hypothetical protein
MKTMLAAYAAAAVTMLGMDVVWLRVSADVLYRPRLGDIMLPGFRPVPAILFYVLYGVGIVIFAIKPALLTGHGRSSGQGRAARLLLLRHLQSHQSGDVEDLADNGDDRRYGLGHVRNRLRGNDGIPRSVKA